MVSQHMNCHRIPVGLFFVFPQRPRIHVRIFRGGEKSIFRILTQFPFDSDRDKGSGFLKNRCCTKDFSKSANENQDRDEIFPESDNISPRPERLRRKAIMSVTDLTPQRTRKMLFLFISLILVDRSSATTNIDFYSGTVSTLFYDSFLSGNSVLDVIYQQFNTTGFLVTGALLLAASGQ